MTSSDTVVAFAAELLGRFPFGTSLRRKHDARMRKEDQELRELQLARLQSVQDRMRDQLPHLGYPDLPNVRLAGLLAASGDEPCESR